MHKVGYGIGSMLLASLLVVVATASAGAHAAFITSNPEPDSVITALPEELRIVFAELVSHTQTQVVVTGPDGTVVSGELTVEENRVRAPLTWAGPGVYQVEWWNVSLDDGHEASGTFQFTLSEE